MPLNNPSWFFLRTFLANHIDIAESLWVIITRPWLWGCAWLFDITSRWAMLENEVTLSQPKNMSPFNSNCRNPIGLAAAQDQVLAGKILQLNCTLYNPGSLCFSVFGLQALWEWPNTRTKLFWNRFQREYSHVNYWTSRNLMKVCSIALTPALKNSFAALES